MKRGLIYCLICPLTNKPKYVGQTIDKNRRLTEHRKNFNYPKEIYSRSRYKNWMIELQMKNKRHEIEIQILEVCDECDLNFKEFQWIQILEKIGFPMTNSLRRENGWGYNSHLEKNRIIEQIRRENISKSTKGVKQGPMSNEAKKNIALSQIGNSKRLGKPCSKEALKNISEGRSGIPAWNKMIVYQYDKQSNFIKEWESIQLASKELNIWNIDSVVGGGRKYAGGFIWTKKKDQFNTVETVWINNSNLKSCKKINILDLPNFLSNGWKEGRKQKFI